jgi:hypothetical protein
VTDLQQWQPDALLPPVKVQTHISTLRRIVHSRKGNDMPRHFKPDPYNGFKDDRERRLALNARARYRALAMASLNPYLREIIGWLLGLLK